MKSQLLSAQTTVYVGFQFLITSLTNPGDTEFVDFLDESNNLLAYVMIRAADTVRVYQGSANEVSIGTVSANQKYYVWLKYVASTDTNGVIEFRMGTTGVYADASITVTESAGTSTAPCTNIRIGNVNSDPGGRAIFDDIKVSSFR